MQVSCFLRMESLTEAPQFSGSPVHAFFWIHANQPPCFCAGWGTILEPGWYLWTWPSRHAGQQSIQNPLGPDALVAPLSDSTMDPNRPLLPDESRASMLIISSLVMHAASIPIVAARIYSRARPKLHFWWDDYTMMAAVVC